MQLAGELTRDVGVSGSRQRLQTELDGLRLRFLAACRQLSPASGRSDGAGDSGAGAGARTYFEAGETTQIEIRHECEEVYLHGAFLAVFDGFGAEVLRSFQRLGRSLERALVCVDRLERQSRARQFPDLPGAELAAKVTRNNALNNASRSGDDGSSRGLGSGGRDPREELSVCHSGHPEERLRFLQTRVEDRLWCGNHVKRSLYLLRPAEIFRQRYTGAFGRRYHLTVWC